MEWTLTHKLALALGLRLELMAVEVIVAFVARYRPSATNVRVIPRSASQ